jgi:putative aldouronate transport system substrate-binding protein
MPHIVIYLYGSPAETEERIQAAINEELNKLTIEKIQATVEITWFGGASYMTSLPLAISSGTRVDLCSTMPSPAVSFTGLSSQGMLMDMGKYLKEYAPKALEIVGGYINATTQDGKILAIPMFKNYLSDQYILLLKDYTDALGLTEKTRNITTWSEFETILRATLDANRGMGGIGYTEIMNYNGGDPDKFSSYSQFDRLGDNNYLIYVDEKTNTVKSIAHSDGFRASCELAKEWNTKGLVYGDASLSVSGRTTDVYSLLRAGAIAARIGEGEYGVEATWGSLVGREVVCPRVFSGTIHTKLVSNWTAGMPVTCKEPEATAKFIELLYTDVDVINLLTRGRKGIDYVLNGNGEACYPDGVDASNVEFHMYDWSYGNQFIIYPWGEGTGGDFRDLSYENMKAGNVSKYLGFAINNRDQNIANLAANCYQVVEKYNLPLYYGVIDLNDRDLGLRAFQSELEAAGINQLLAAYQSQLDTWLATK